MHKPDQLRACRETQILQQARISACSEVYRGFISNDHGIHEPPPLKVYNHDFYWNSLSAGGPGEPTGDLLEAINDAFDSFDDFKEAFTASASGHFGSGWAWLVLNTDGGLEV